MAKKQNEHTHEASSFAKLASALGGILLVIILLILTFAPAMLTVVASMLVSGFVILRPNFEILQLKLPKN